MMSSEKYVIARGAIQYGYKTWKTRGWAERALRDLQKRWANVSPSQIDELDVITLTELKARDHDVLVKNLLTGGLCTIKASQRGGCCDPSTETYHCM